MLKIKDNKIQKKLKGYWIFEEYKYLDDLDFVLNEFQEKYGISNIIDEILIDEGYEINFDNCAYLSRGNVVSWEFNNKYSIELFEFSATEKKYTLSFVIKEITSFKNIWELVYLKEVYEKIVKNIKADLVEKVSD